MTSFRKAQANRMNALTSTGPRSINGKRRSSGNARKHGLSVCAHLDASANKEAVRLALDIAGVDGSLEMQRLALKIANSHFDWLRVRDARISFIEQNIREEEASSEEGASSNEVECKEVRVALAFVRNAARIRLFDRYEKRALSRRKTAIREYDAAQVRFVADRA